MALIDTFENSSYVAEPLYTECWLRAWLGWVDRNKDFFEFNITEEADFASNLKEVGFYM